MKIKFIVFGLILFAAFGCNDSTKEKNTLDKGCRQELNEAKAYIKQIKDDLRKPFNYDVNTQEWGFCSTTEALTTTRAHNTRIGISKFTIPIPRGSHLKLRTKTKNKLIYDCKGNGNIFSGNVIFKNKTVTGMSEVEGAIIEVEVYFSDFSENRCPQNGPTKLALTDPKKSIINGHPLWQ